MEKENVTPFVPHRRSLAQKDTFSFSPHLVLEDHPEIELSDPILFFAEYQSLDEERVEMVKHIRADPSNPELWWKLIAFDKELWPLSSDASSLQSFVQIHEMGLRCIETLQPERQSETACAKIRINLAVLRSELNPSIGPHLFRELAKDGMIHRMEEFEKGVKDFEVKHGIFVHLPLGTSKPLNPLHVGVSSTETTYQENEGKNLRDVATDIAGTTEGKSFDPGYRGFIGEGSRDEQTIGDDGDEDDGENGLQTPYHREKKPPSRRFGAVLRVREKGGTEQKNDDPPTSTFRFTRLSSQRSHKKGMFSSLSKKNGKGGKRSLLSVGPARRVKEEEVVDDSEDERREKEKSKHDDPNEEDDDDDSTDAHDEDGDDEEKQIPRRISHRTPFTAVAKKIRFEDEGRDTKTTGKHHLKYMPSSSSSSKKLLSIEEFRRESSMLEKKLSTLKSSKKDTKTAPTLRESAAPCGSGNETFAFGRSLKKPDGFGKKDLTHSIRKTSAGGVIRDVEEECETNVGRDDDSHMSLSRTSKRRKSDHGSSGTRHRRDRDEDKAIRSTTSFLLHEHDEEDERNGEDEESFKNASTYQVEVEVDAKSKGTSTTVGTKAPSRRKSEDVENPIPEVEEKREIIKEEEEEVTTADSGKKAMTQSDQMLKQFGGSKIFVVQGVSYVSLELIGRGGSSKVFKVLGSNRKIYALKHVRLSKLERSAKSGFINEVRLLKTLRGKDLVVQLVNFELQKETEVLQMVMEFGETDLHKMLHRLRGKSMSDHFVRLYWQQMLEAVNCVHNARIVHSDLKPANFLLVQGQLKLIDFGISKAMNAETTHIIREGQIGTLNYMSPEAIEFVPGSSTTKLGRASDVWSLGCILYQMLFGKCPFADLNMVQKIAAITSEEPKISYPSHADPLAIDVLKKCLRRNAKERPSIEELLMHPFLRGLSEKDSFTSTSRKPSSDANPETLIADQMCLLNGVDLNTASGRKVQQRIVDQIRSGQPIDIHKAML